MRPYNSLFFSAHVISEPISHAEAPAVALQIGLRGIEVLTVCSLYCNRANGNAESESPVGIRRSVAYVGMGWMVLLMVVEIPVYRRSGEELEVFEEPITDESIDSGADGVEFRTCRAHSRIGEINHFTIIAPAEVKVDFRAHEQTFHHRQGEVVSPANLEPLGPERTRGNSTVDIGALIVRLLVLHTGNPSPLLSGERRRRWRGTDKR